MKKYLMTILALALLVFIPGKVNAATKHITFDTQGGTPGTIDAINLDDSEILHLPTVTKEGATFGGWYYIDSSMPEPMNKVQVVDEKPASWLVGDAEGNVTLIASWVTAIDSVNITVKLPVGTEVTTTNPIAESTVTVPSGAKYTAFPEGAGLIKAYDDDSAFVGTIEEGKDYYIELWVAPNGGVFTKDTVIKVNGKDTFKVGAYYADEEGKIDPSLTASGFLLYAKVTAGEEVSETTEYKILNGADQTYVEGTDLAIRADGDLEKFTKLLIDDVEVSKEYYTTAKGSTIATIKASFLSTLKAGEHKVTFVYTDGKVDTSITIPKTKANVKNPNTSDNIKLYSTIFGLSVISFVASSIIIKKRNS